MSTRVAYQQSRPSVNSGHRLFSRPPALYHSRAIVHWCSSFNHGYRRSSHLLHPPPYTMSSLALRGDELIRILRKNNLIQDEAALYSPALRSVDDGESLDADGYHVGCDALDLHDPQYEPVTSTPPPCLIPICNTALAHPAPYDNLVSARRPT